MKKTLLTLFSLVIAINCLAIDAKRISNQDYKNLIYKSQVVNGVPIDRKTIISGEGLKGKGEGLLANGERLRAKGESLRKSAESDSIEKEFIFDPQGVEKMYCMSLYSYDSNNSKFVSAISLKSQVRFDADGKTVYFKDLTKSLGVKTWLKGTIDGDTINIPYGQPLAYYKGKYLVFFCPMIYDDNKTSSNMEVQDNFKLIIKGDSLVSPTFDDGVFQGAAGYVYVSDATQGFLSYDLHHNMRFVKEQSFKVPENVEAVEYVYSMENSYGSTYKKKSLVKKDGNDLYMQLSTSAPDAYVHGTLNGDSIFVESGQVITDSTFLYFYSLADPIYDEIVTDSIVDFVPVVSGNRLAWHEADKSITSSPTVFGVDYMDGMNLCREYITNPRFTVYGGDKVVKPMAPQLYKIYLDGGIIGSMSFNYMIFNLFALDVDSNYINKDSISYRMYYDDEVYTFDPDTYKNLSQPMTEIPYTFKDNADFWVYDQQHYVYLYEDLFTTIGVQSVYTVNGKKYYSDIVGYNTETEEQYVTKVENRDPADVNGDGTVDISDVNAIIAVICNSLPTGEGWGEADVNGDGTVDISDVNAVISVICGQ